MRRLFFVLVLGFLVLDATGVEALVRPEPCTSLQDNQPDGTCPPTCVRCACAVQVIVPPLVVSFASTPLEQELVDLYARRAPRTIPAEIFHVPKHTSPAI